MRSHRPGLEIAAVFVLLLALVWRAGDWLAPTDSSAGLVNGVLGALVAVIVVGSWWRDGVGLRALGLLPAEWSRGWGSMTVFVAVGCAVLAIVGAAIGTVSLANARPSWLVDYAPGITAQQLLLQGFFVPHIATLAQALPPRRQRGATIAVASLLFVALHAPNPALMIGVSAGLRILDLALPRHRNLLAVLVGHLLLGATAMAMLGPGPMLNLRVGPGALELLAR